MNKKILFQLAFSCNMRYDSVIRGLVGQESTYERGKNDMTQNAAQANTTIWVFAIILVGWTLIQAALFVRLALRFN